MIMILIRTKKTQKLAMLGRKKLLIQSLENLKKLFHQKIDKKKLAVPMIYKLKTKIYKNLMIINLKIYC